jgi:hypothetical protein
VLTSLDPSRALEIFPHLHFDPDTTKHTHTHTYQLPLSFSGRSLFFQLSLPPNYWEVLPNLLGLVATESSSRSLKTPGSRRTRFILDDYARLHPCLARQNILTLSRLIQTEQRSNALSAHSASTLLSPIGNRTTVTVLLNLLGLVFTPASFCSFAHDILYNIFGLIGFYRFVLFFAADHLCRNFSHLFLKLASLSVRFLGDIISI